ncbi:hypothetical protein GUY60_12040, partial [Streptomyces sp. YC537]
PRRPSTPDRPGTPTTQAARVPSTPAPTESGRAAGDVVGWAAFSCVLVPVVLVVYGTSLGGAAGAALGLVAVTGVCRVLLRRSERGAAHLLAEQNGARRSESARHRRGDLAATGTRPESDSRTTRH